MKRTYISPDIMVHKIHVSTILAGSPFYGTGLADKNGTCLSKEVNNIINFCGNDGSSEEDENK